MKQLFSGVFVFFCVVGTASAYIADSGVARIDFEQSRSNAIEHEVVLILYKWQPVVRFTCENFDFLVLISPDRQRYVAAYSIDDDVFAFVEFLVVTKERIRSAVRTQYKWWVDDGHKKMEFVSRLSESAALQGYSSSRIALCISP
ncbi:hypothetical protein KC902_00400 [Candidatus Kaiserbacteria bacterium]|nr:hypothetical protein [Candidatus Kaiserbacteria bacterium]USN88890.1 MAG: hypothetical protein H6780_00495 [Candidatus Nomurabacteria bacterium]